MTEQELDTILEYLRRSRGFDFTAYKRTTLKRRLDKRMQTLGVDTYEAYLDHLEVHPDEFSALFNTILINVTCFFRDPPVWEYLATDVLSPLLARKAPNDPIRIWSAGCASGEEAYTLAILFAEALGPNAFRDRVKIYGTDVDEEALAQARQAVYTPRQMENVPPDLLKKYFEPANGNFAFQKDLRRSVIFGRHDLIQDAPISRVDLLTCRNTLMYFNSEIQSRILARFYFALHEGGYLLLGKAEMLFNHSAMFGPVDLKRRIFRAVPKMNQRERLLLLAQVGRDEPRGTDATFSAMEVGRAAFDIDVMPQLVVDATGTLLLANDQARRQFGLSQQDLGRPLQDLEISYRPVELRSAIEQAIDGRVPVIVKDIEWARAPGETWVLDVNVVPLTDQTGGILGTKVTFSDVSRYRNLQKELQNSKRELETAYEELQSTNEELETTNEELQSTVEELETTNEELQSTNEELETMNEELQSTNEELQTMNEELRTRSGELNAVNSFLEAVLASLRAAVVVVDPHFHVQEWNARAEDLWGLRNDEVKGAHLLDLDFGLPIQDLKPAIRKSLTGAREAQVLRVPATNRRGRAFTCRVTCTPLAAVDGSIRGALLVMEDDAMRQPEPAGPA